MANLPQTFADKLEPIPYEKFGENAEQASLVLAARGYEVQYGITREYARAVGVMAVEGKRNGYSTDNSSHDHLMSPELIERWLGIGGGKAMYLLLQRMDLGERLGGYGWVERHASNYVPEGEYTLSVRIDTIARKQVATSFTALVVASAWEELGVRNMWTEVWESEHDKTRMYGRIGFEPVEYVPTVRTEPRRKAFPDVKIYMLLTEEGYAAANR